MTETESSTIMYEYDSSCDNTNVDLQDGSRVFQVVFYMLFASGLMGNCTVLWILLQHMKLKTMSDVFLLNLVLSDLLLAISFPLWIHTSQNLVSCKLATGVYQIGFFSGTLFVTLMSVDRYLAIVHAVAGMRVRTIFYGIIASFIVWIISVIMAAPEAFFASLEPQDNETFACHPMYPDETRDFWKKRKNFSENTVSLFVCLPIIVFCYMRILTVLSKSRNCKKIKAVKLVFTVVGVFVVCWIPYNIFVFLETLEIVEILNSCKISNTIKEAISYTEIIALSHCCLNPIVYAFIGEKFRKSLGLALKKHFRSKSRGSSGYKETTDNDTSNTGVRSTTY